MNNPETPDIYAWAPIQPVIWESAIRMYDRYMEVVLTAPQKKDSPEIMSMSQFINYLMIRGLMSQGELLFPMEKELGII